MRKRELVEDVAHSLWEQEGKPAGQELVYHLEAERLVEERQEKRVPQEGNRRSARAHGCLPLPWNTGGDVPRSDGTGG